jgi:CheY-like chemotaxis protein
VDTLTQTTNSSPSRVLIVEDNRDSRESLRWLLELWGHEVEVAEDGQRGVAEALRWKPDTAVVDIGLPLLDGYQVARQVRAALRDRVVLIALTGYGKPEDRSRALQAGFDVFLTKPADPQCLQRVLAENHTSGKC